MKHILSVAIVFFMIASIPGLCPAESAIDARMEPARQMEEIPAFIDVVFLRPAGVVACIAGLAATVLALPFALPSGSMDKVTKALINDPFYFTFKRPIGEGVRPAVLD
ncbi:MAG: hypothetical protein CVU61_14010 [Deltaproteobacteria bacterium HGW-Deltaproteobacteria-19]|nr:MAG: hypothetical protein CVU61_14010 [Deltaproteobacteria bacterium HGW-Deltaproteobacteria-19]